MRMTDGATPWLLCTMVRRGHCPSTTAMRLCSLCAQREFPARSWGYVDPACRDPVQISNPRGGPPIDVVGGLVSEARKVVDSGHLTFHRVHLGTHEEVIRGHEALSNAGVFVYHSGANSTGEISNSRGSKTFISEHMRSKDKRAAIRLWPQLNQAITAIEEKAKKAVGGKKKNVVNCIWLAQYEKSDAGSFRMHVDRKVFDRRLMLTWGTSKKGKKMVIQNAITGEYFVISVPHGSLVGMSAFMAGLAPQVGYLHGVSHAEGTGTTGIDISL